MTGLDDSEIASEMKAVQDLFLASQPQLIDGVERVDVNGNTRLLVLRLYQSSDEVRRLRDAYRALTGRLAGDKRAQSEVASYLRQADSLRRLARFDEAEATINAGLQQWPNHPDLIAHLGVLYAYWLPVRRVADARAHFERSSQLGCRREILYSTWSEMENRNREWSSAIRVADLGMARVGATMRLTFRAGYAHSRLGQEFRNSFHHERAENELRLADELLTRALKQSEERADAFSMEINRRAYRAIVLNCEALGDIGRMHKTLNEWRATHAGDANATSETNRLCTKYPLRLA